MLMEENETKATHYIDLRRETNSSVRQELNKLYASKGVILRSTPPTRDQSGHKPLELKVSTFLHRYRSHNSLSEHGISPSISHPWFSPLQRLKNIDLCQGTWWKIWIPGCVALGIFGIPRGMTAGSVLHYLQKIPLPLNWKIKIKNLMVLFGEEATAVNPLGPCLNGPPGGETLSLAQFSCEEDARMFWSLCETGVLMLYGHRLSCYPDPSGYRVFGEAVMGNFRYEDLESTQSCHCCETDQINLLHDSEKRECCVLLLPFVTYGFVQQKLMAILEKSKYKVQWRSNIPGALIEFHSARDLEMFCLPQRYQFIFNQQKKTMIQASVFHLGRRVTPCIINPLEETLFSLHSVVTSSSSKKRLTIPHATASASTPVWTVSLLNSLPDTTSLSEIVTKSSFEAPTVKRPRGRPKGSTKKNS